MCCKYKNKITYIQEIIHKKLYKYSIKQHFPSGKTHIDSKITRNNSRCSKHLACIDFVDTRKTHSSV